MPTSCTIGCTNIEKKHELVTYVCNLCKMYLSQLIFSLRKVTLFRSAKTYQQHTTNLPTAYHRVPTAYHIIPTAWHHLLTPCSVELHKSAGGGSSLDRGSSVSHGSSVNHGSDGCGVTAHGMALRTVALGGALVCTTVSNFFTCIWHIFYF